MKNLLYHAIKRRSKTGKIIWYVRSVTLESYLLRKLHYGVDDLYFENELDARAFVAEKNKELL